MADFIDHIESYIVFASSPSVNTSAAPSSSFSTSTRNDSSQSSSIPIPNSFGAGVLSLSELNNLEPISWSCQGGYDHPQPGSRLLQYGAYGHCCLTCFYYSVSLSTSFTSCFLVFIVCPSDCLSVRLSVYQSVYLSACLVSNPLFGCIGSQMPIFTFPCVILVLFL